MYVDLAEDLSRAAVPVWAPCDEGWPGQDNREHGQVSGNRAAVHVKKNTEGWPRQDHREHGQVSGNRAAAHVRTLKAGLGRITENTDKYQVTEQQLM